MTQGLETFYHCDASNDSSRKKSWQLGSPSLVRGEVTKMINGFKTFQSMVTVVWVLTTVSGCSWNSGKTIVAPLDGDGWLSEKGYYEKTVHYGTNRIDKCRNPKLLYDTCVNDPLRLNTGNKRGGGFISYGRATVKIPWTKEVGGTSGMSMTHLIHGIDWYDFMSRISADDLLIFIHGFNTSFSNAAIRCAQLAHDTSFKGEAVFFSWPSAENFVTYARDKKRAQEDFELLATFLQNIASNTDKNVHIVAHSMGTFLLMNSLAVLDQRIKKDDNILHSRREKFKGKMFGQIILAAPDIAKEDYQRNFTRHDFRKMAERITLYSAENDYVLSGSRIFNFLGEEETGQPRLDDFSESFFVINGMDTVDTRQEISAQFFGHSFYGNYRSLVSDMHILLNYGTHPDNRMLQKVSDKDDHILWFIRD